MKARITTSSLAALRSQIEQIGYVDISDAHEVDGKKIAIHIHPDHVGTRSWVTVDIGDWHYPIIRSIPVEPVNTGILDIALNIHEGIGKLILSYAYDEIVEVADVYIPTRKIDDHNYLVVGRYMRALGELNNSEWSDVLGHATVWMNEERIIDHCDKVVDLLFKVEDYYISLFSEQGLPQQQIKAQLAQPMDDSVIARALGQSEW